MPIKVTTLRQYIKSCNKDKLVMIIGIALVQVVAILGSCVVYFKGNDYEN